MDCSTETIELTMPAETIERLRLFANAYGNGRTVGLNNAASMAINRGIDTFVERFPDYLEQPKEPSQ